jgi:hypothetical protein
MLKPSALFRSKKKKTLILQFINSNLITTLTHNPLIAQFKFNKGTIYKRNNLQNINTNKTYNSSNTSIQTYEWCYSKQLQTK